MFKEVEEKLEKMYKGYKFKIIKTEYCIKIIHTYREKMFDKEFISDVANTFDTMTNSPKITPPAIIYDYENEIEELSVSEECDTVTATNSKIEELEYSKEYNTIHQIYSSLSDEKNIKMLNTRPYKLKLDISNYDDNFSSKSQSKIIINSHSRRLNNRLKLNLFLEVINYFFSNQCLKSSQCLNHQYANIKDISYKSKIYST